jgi:hypothetical protein
MKMVTSQDELASNCAICGNLYPTAFEKSLRRSTGGRRMANAQNCGTLIQCVRAGHSPRAEQSILYISRDLITYRFAKTRPDSLPFILQILHGGGTLSTMDG